jgi:ATP-dependent exoDNAse (exonuclease V) beta subunit
MSLTFISAGAGSGKTHTLMQTLGGLLETAQVRPGGVIATTFTKKAATELRERVRQHLLGAGRIDLANAMGQARIGTVNSVCGSLLERFAFEAGMATRQQVLDEAQTAQLVREAIEAAMSGEEVKTVSALAHRLGMKDWTGDIASLLAQARGNDIDPEKLPEFARLNADKLLGCFPAPLRATLTEDLATEIRRALPQLRQAAETSTVKKTQGYIATLEKFDRAVHQGTDTWAQWIALSKETPEKGLVPLAEPIQMLARACDAHPQLHADIRSYLERMFVICAAALDHYRNRKLAMGVVDFTDQEHLLLKLLDNPEVEGVLGDELDLLLVDEFQDTSPIQLALFLKLSRLAKHTYWVGDIKQAIYGFRGSDTDLMQAVVAALPNMDGHKRILGGSWRSRPALVQVVNEVFVPAFSSSLTVDEVALQAQRSESTNNPALCRWMLGGKNVDEIAQSVVEGVRKLLASAYRIPDKSTGELRPLQARDIAILCRSNEAVIQTAARLRQAGVPAATAQPGLLATPEATLALACLRRLNDPSDTVATAEILSLVDGQEPEVWLADRLNYLQQGGRRSAWRESGDNTHPVLALLAGLRSELPLLTPYEALRRVIAACDIPQTVLQWRQEVAVARTRLANLEALLNMAAQYEDVCQGTRQASTVSGLLLWLRAQALAMDDALAEPGVDAVRVLTHHAAKGLEWPVVVLTDLDKEVRNRLWGISTISPAGVDAVNPLKDRFIRYWPWPFGLQSSGIAVKDTIDASATAQAFQVAAVAEAQRLLYVSMTRPREMLVLTLKDKAKAQAWLDCLDAPWLMVGDKTTTELQTPAGVRIPALTWQLGADAQLAAVALPPVPLFWPKDQPASQRLPLYFNPSSVAATEGMSVEKVTVGARISVMPGVDWGVLGSAIHACLAASFTNEGTWLAEERVSQVLQAFQVRTHIDAADLCKQIAAFHAWVRQRWPGCTAKAEVPVTALLSNGQILNGRIDLLLETDQGYVLIDHKSSPLGEAQWDEIVGSHQGQLAAYAGAIEAATGSKVIEQWLWLPVAGGMVRASL